MNRRGFLSSIAQKYMTTVFRTRKKKLYKARNSLQSGFGILVWEKKCVKDQRKMDQFTFSPKCII